MRTKILASSHKFLKFCPRLIQILFEIICFFIFALSFYIIYTIRPWKILMNIEIKTQQILHLDFLLLIILKTKLTTIFWLKALEQTKY
jgi:hypothetical protein